MTIYTVNYVYLSCSLRSVLCSALDLSVLNMEGNFGTFLTDDFFSHILIRNPFHKLATLDISFNDQGGVR